MPSIAERFANLLSALLSQQGLPTLAGSPGRVGDEFQKLIAAVIHEWKTAGFRRVRREAARLSVQFLPVVLYGGATVVLLFAAILSLRFWIEKNSPVWSLALWIFVLGIWVSALPLLSRTILRNVARAYLSLLEFLVLVISLAVFAALILHLPLLHVWVLYAGGLIALLAAGGYWVELVQRQTEHSLLEEWNRFRVRVVTDGPSLAEIEKQLSYLKRKLYLELAVYSALPLGVTIGILVGIHFGHTPIQITSICLRWIFGLASLPLLVFLYASIRRMIDPALQLESMLSLATLRTGTNAARDWGCVLTEYRKMFLADCVENTALLIAFSLLTWLLTGPHNISALDAKFVTGVVVLSIVVNQIPYLIGQWKLQEALVSESYGWEKITRLKEANEHIPLVPKFEFVAAIIGEASAGGLAIEFTKKIAEFVGKP